MKEIKKRINIKKVDVGVCEIFYLAPETDGKDENGYERIKLGSKRKVLNLETFQVQSKISKEQLKDLDALHGIEIDSVGMLKSVLENESQMQTQKLITNIMKYAGEQNYKIGFTKLQASLCDWFGFIPKKRIKSEDDINKILMVMSNKIASGSRLGPANYIIVSAGLGARIMDLPQFVFNDPNQPLIDQGSGFVYKTGQLGTSLEVLVDPSMRFADLTVIMGKNSQENSEGIYMAYMDPEMDQIDIVDEKDFMPYTLVQLRSRCAIHPTENAHLQYMTFEFTDKPHNIFTHLWNKIFGKK